MKNKRRSILDARTLPVMRSRIRPTKKAKTVTMVEYLWNDEVIPANECSCAYRFYNGKMGVTLKPHPAHLWELIIIERYHYSFDRVEDGYAYFAKNLYGPFRVRISQKAWEELCRRSGVKDERE